MVSNATANATKICFHDIGNLEVPDEKWELGFFFNGTSFQSNISYFCEETKECCSAFSCCDPSEGRILLVLGMIIICLCLLCSFLLMICTRKSRGCRGFLFTLRNWSYIHRQRRAEQSYAMAQMRENPFTVM